MKNILSLQEQELHVTKIQSDIPLIICLICLLACILLGVSTKASKNMEVIWSFKVRFTRRNTLRKMLLKQYLNYSYDLKATLYTVNRGLGKL